MITISKDNEYLTLINVFRVKTEDQGQLIDLLTKATKESVSKLDGFISASLHKSKDGTKVVMYAQWKSEEHYQNMRRNASASPFLDEALKIATFEMGMYDVAETFLPG